MKAHLMYLDRDFESTAKLPDHAPTLIQDLELDTLFSVMARGDEYLLGVARRAVLSSLTDPLTIRYRQHILTDCLERADVVRRMYAIAVEALEGERKVWAWGSLWRSPDSVLHRSLEVLHLFLPLLRQLRQLADAQASRFQSAGFVQLWGMLSRELSEEYLQGVAAHLRKLTFPGGLLISAALGEGNKGTAYVLREPPPIRTWWGRFVQWREHRHEKPNPTYTYEVPPRDESGHQALADLKHRGIARTAAALGRSAEHVQHFFRMLRAELGFYIGCMNLHERLVARSHPVCFPEVLDATEMVFSAEGLYDVALALKVQQGIVGNDVQGSGKSLVMITGANRGGKSTLLRSVGQVHLMMQCGLFVPAAGLHANVCPSIFTHFKREEDATLRSGKLDEELQRMSAIVAHIEAHSLLLCNESFGSTNEREGSEIARQIVRALLEHEVKVFYVTHLFDLADSLRKTGMGTALFLRAERLADGRRTFRIETGDPLPTSFGEDLYRRIFGGEAGQRQVPADEPVHETSASWPTA